MFITFHNIVLLVLFWGMADMETIRMMNVGAVNQLPVDVATTSYSEGPAASLIF